MLVLLQENRRFRRRLARDERRREKGEMPHRDGLVIRSARLLLAVVVKTEKQRSSKRRLKDSVSIPTTGGSVSAHFEPERHEKAAPRESNETQREMVPRRDQLPAVVHTVALKPQVNATVVLLSEETAHVERIRVAARNISVAFEAFAAVLESERRVCEVEESTLGKGTLDYQNLLLGVDSEFMGIESLRRRTKHALDNMEQQLAAYTYTS